MKIETSGSDRLTPSSTDNIKSAERARLHHAAGAKNPDRADQAALSDRARLLGKARAALSEIPDIRADLVKSFRSKIQSGDYSIPYDQLAGRLMRSAAYG
jgi:flagellar biosynthesis anti-sigma factor FlgM